MKIETTQKIKPSTSGRGWHAVPGEDKTSCNNCDISPTQLRHPEVAEPQPNRSMQNLNCHPELVSGSSHCDDEGSPLTPTLSRRARGKRAAFTLAEVLITLAIIGVVAAMTIPTLITSYTEKATVTALKKVLSTFSQGYLHAVFENGTPDTWGLTAGTAEGAAKFIKIIQPYFKITKICEEDSSCLNDIYYTLQGTKKRIYTDRASAILNDGSTIWIYVFDSNSPQITDQTNPSLKNGVVAELTADINGFAGPNIFGKDVFSFWVTKNNIIPKGRKGDSYTIENYCNLAVPEEEAHYNSGESCSSWVIDIGNMDYLHCDDLSWTGKHKCSD